MGIHPKRKTSRGTRPAAGDADLHARLRRAGLKLTPQRLAIVRALCADRTHPTAQELFDRLRFALPTMSFATVYNTLDALASAGLCSALSLVPGAARFDGNMHPHHHAVCDCCGKVRDIAVAPEMSCDISQAARHADLAGDGSLGFQVRVVERVYRGLCASCAPGAAARAPAG